MQVMKKKLAKNYCHTVGNCITDGCDVALYHASRPSGVHIVGGKGSMKSRFMGKWLAYDDVENQIPTIMIDPANRNGLIDNFLDAVDAQIERGELDSISVEQKRISEKALDMEDRIRYIDMSGSSGYVTPFPFLYQNTNESLYSISNRFLDVLRLVDPKLDDAPVNGTNAIKPILTMLGAVLFPMGFQLTEAESLMNNPKEWEPRFEALVNQIQDNTRYAEDVKRAVDWWKNGYNRSMAVTLKGKLTDFIMDSTNRAIFGASKQGIDWKDVISNGLCVLINTSDPNTTKDMKAFKMLWVLKSLISFLDAGGSDGQPVSIYIDELSSIYNTSDNAISQEMDELLNNISRRNNLWVTVAHQECYQFEERTIETLMSMGTQIIGVTSDPRSAMMYADRFDNIDVDMVKKEKPVYWRRNGGYTPYERELDYEIIDYDESTYPIQEQIYMHREKYMSIPPGHFFIKRPYSPIKLTKVYIQGADEDVCFDRVAEMKLYSMQTYGRPVSDIEAEIQARLNPPDPPAKIKEYEAPRNDIQIDLAADITESTSLDEICRLYEAAVKNKDYDRAGAILSKQVEIGLASEKVRASWSIQLKETGLFNDYFEQEEKNDLWEEI